MSLLLLVAFAVATANILQIEERITAKNATVLRCSVRSSDGQRSSIDVALDFAASYTGNGTVAVELLLAESRSLRQWLDVSGNRRVDAATVVRKCVRGALDTQDLIVVARETVEFSANLSEAQVRLYAGNLSEGIYYTVASNCEESLREVRMNGTVEVENPYGYLPGEAYPCLNLYKLLTGMYAVLLFVWSARVCMHRESTIALQRYAVTCVLFSALLEYMLTFAICEYMNEFGAQPDVLVICAAVTKAFKDTFTRALMLAISKGVGVIRDSLESATLVALLAISGGYLVSHLVYEAELYQSMKLHRVHPGQILSSLFLSLCSTVLFYWIYMSLIVTQKELKVSKQTFKLKKIKAVAGALEVTAIWAISWIFFQSYFLLTTSQDDYWRIYWLFEGMWQLIFLFVVCALAWLWRPDEQWTVRASSEQLRQDDELEREKEGLEMVSQRTVGYMLGTEAQD